MQPLQGIDEVNFFKDDGSIIHFKKPEVQAAVASNTFAIFGNPETKRFSDLMPEILQHIGPKQMPMLKELMENTKKEKGVRIRPIARSRKSTRQTKKTRRKTPPSSCRDKTSRMQANKNDVSSKTIRYIYPNPYM